LGWPGRSPGHYRDSSALKQTFPIRAIVLVGAVAPPGQPAVSQRRHRHPALGQDRPSRPVPSPTALDRQPDGAGDDSHANQQCRLQRSFMSGQCCGDRCSLHRPLTPRHAWADSVTVIARSVGHSCTSRCVAETGPRHGSGHPEASKRSAHKPARGKGLGGEGAAGAARILPPHSALDPTHVLRIFVAIL